MKSHIDPARKSASEQLQAVLNERQAKLHCELAVMLELEKSCDEWPEWFQWVFLQMFNEITDWNGIWLPVPPIRDHDTSEREHPETR